MQAYASENKKINENIYLTKYKQKSLTIYGKICKINLQFMEIKSELWHISFEKKSVVKNSFS